VLFCVDFAFNSLNIYGANKKSISVKDLREGERMKFVVHDVFPETSLIILDAIIYIKMLLLCEWCMDLTRVERTFYQ